MDDSSFPTQSVVPAHLSDRLVEVADCPVDFDSSYPSLKPDLSELEEVPMREVVTVGMFLVNKHPAIVLFDSGASHSFMSQAFASKYDQKIIEVNKGGYIIVWLGLLSLQIR